MSHVDETSLGELTSSAAIAIHGVKSVLGARRFFTGAKKKTVGATAVDYLTAYQPRALDAGLPALLDRLLQEDQVHPTQLPVQDALADWIGLRPRLGDLGDDPEVRPVTIFGQLADSIETIDAALRREQRFRDEAKAAGEAVRRMEVRKLMVEMPVERLKDATRDRLRIGPLTDAGIRTIQAVLDRGAALEHLPGIGATTASRIRGAAQTLWQTTYEEMPVRIDIKARTSEGTELLRRLGAWEAMRKTKGATPDLALKDALGPVVKAIDKKVTHLVVFAAGRTVAQFQEAAHAVNQRAAQVSGKATGSAAKDSWDDFLARPADYFAMLSELGFVTENEEKAHGDLPDEIVEAVRTLELNTQHLNASLRGYQSFAARFALTQRKVIIGDEMGRGKTVEAIAVMAHLRAKGSHHALVICPAAVVTNWVREVQSKSSLRPHRVHGPGRDSALRNWVRNGGVAVTTYDGIDYLGRNLPAHGDFEDLACVVVDEAHYIKNPEALRSKRTAHFIGFTDYAILLTGTPMENRIEEFHNLVGYLRPDLIVDANELAPRRFRRQVAPAYLRRNQEDVLTELPELVEVDEWLPLSTSDSRTYRDAVAAGNFMAMRQAAVADRDSEKIKRLVEIVEEAEENSRRVIVFSHFRNVLDQVANALPGKVFGPLTGSVPAAARQSMVDQFSAAAHGAVLVSQIVAGGVGLNIQAASVVVIVEPQLKPTTEWQAIARARRMGQLETVQVHRLLSEEGVDQRIIEILARKKELFDDFARVSETAESAPEAFDISEAELAREVVAAERERLFNQANGLSGDEEAV
ncbi:DEAD/DEAH box helicase [Nocardioides hungaricus]